MAIEAPAAVRTESPSNQSNPRHPSPNLGMLAVIFTILKLASIGVVSNLSGIPAFPSPQQPLGEIVSYFQTYSPWVLWCAFLQFGSAIPLGLFVAVSVSRLRFLGIRAAG